MAEIENITEELINSIRTGFKEKGLKRSELNDKVFTEIMDRLSLEDRLRVLYYCAINDTFQKIKN